MLEMDLRQPGFTYNVCRPFTKSKEEAKYQKKQDFDDTFIKTN